MQLSKSVKEQFVDGITFRNYLQKKLGRINDYDDNEVKCHKNDLDFLDGYYFVKDNPKVIKVMKLIKQRVLKEMKEYFVKYDEDLTKRNVRSYISGYKQLCAIPCCPMYYFFTDEEVDNFVIECFDNDLGEILLQRRIMYRRAAKRAVTNTMRLGALGVKVNIAGRLNGAEIARTEWYREGRVPLHTFRANIDYGFSEAQTTYGIIGVKVWIFLKDLNKDDDEANVTKPNKKNN